MPVDPALMRQLMGELESEVRGDMAADGVAQSDQTVEFEADLRFSKQIYELQMPIAPGPFTESSSGALLASFMDEYAKRYGKGSIVLRTPVELVGLRAIGVGQTIRAGIGTAMRGAVERGTLATPVGTRQVRLRRGPDGMVEVDVYDGTMLAPGHEFKGAALVDSMDTTVWVPEGGGARIDEHGTFIMEVAP
jgi:N-methylhydantoinase A